ncbi:MAG: hypothetical protein E5W01_02515 [Mesorhizobium sp.]|nr:MAG: hypothetical protein E5W01_02515 [Mesorhizobium sp.]
MEVAIAKLWVRLQVSETTLWLLGRGFRRQMTLTGDPGCTCETMRKILYAHRDFTLERIEWCPKNNNTSLTWQPNFRDFTLSLGR